MSTPLRMPLLSCPGTIIFLDDERGYLDKIKFMIPDNIPYLLETDPNAVLEYMNIHAYREDVLSTLISKL